MESNFWILLFLACLKLFVTVVFFFSNFFAKFRDIFDYEEPKCTKHYTDQTHRTSGLRSWDDLLFSVSGIQSEGSYPRREDSGSRLCQGSSPRQRTRHLKSNFDFSNNSTFRKATGFKKKTPSGVVPKLRLRLFETQLFFLESYFAMNLLDLYFELEKKSCLMGYCRTTSPRR